MGNDSSKGSSKGQFILSDDKRDIKSDYTFGRKLGEPGGYGYAQQVTNIKTGKVHAVKVINKARFQRHKSADGLEMFRREMKIMSEMRHPNLVHGIDSYEDDKNLYFVMELCAGGELFDRIQALQEKKQHYSESAAALVVKQILLGLQHMHKNNIMHCDLKPDNFLFDSKDEDATLKICDFGMSRYVKRREYMHQLCGTTFYMAPEVVRGRYTYHCDLWSVGIVVFILLCGFPPFFGDDDNLIRAKIKHGFTPEVKEGYGPWFPAHITLSAQAKDFISKLLEYDPAVRLSSTEALEHAWINGSASKDPIVGSVLRSLGSFQKDCAFKAAILDVMADSFSDAELKEFTESFRQYDVDGDGFITIDELKSQSDSKQNTALQTILTTIDVDGDGRISYDELVRACIQKKLLAKEERIYNVFSQLDQNGDGVLTEQEIQDALMDDPDLEGARKMLSEIDKDGDGKVDYNEFLNMFFVDSTTQVAPE